MIAHSIFARVPWLGKYAVSFLAGFWYQQILKEGVNYGRRKTEVSRVRDGVGIGGRETTGEVREVRTESSSVFGTRTNFGRLREKQEQEKETN